MKTNSKVPSKNQVRLANFVADFLSENGITDVFMLTGHGAMYLNDALAHHPKIKYYCSRNEATAPMMAEAYARLSGKLCAVCLTAGPGSTNAIPGLAEAWVDSAPIIIISGQVPSKHTTYQTKLPGLRSFGTAEINIVPIVYSLTKYVVTVTNPNDIKFHLEKAIYLAQSGRPGPVWIDIPLDIQSSIIDLKALKSFEPPMVFKIRKNTKFERALKLLLSSKKPIIVAGHGIRQSGSIPQFQKLINTLKLPVFLTRLGNDILPFSNHYNLGMPGMRGIKYANALTKQADYVLVLGSRLAIPVVGYDFENFNKKAKIVVVDIEKAELEKPGIHIDIPINNNVKDFILSFTQKVKSSKFNWNDWLKFCQKVKKKFPQVTPDSQRDPIDVYYLMSRIDAASIKNHVLVTDTGSHYYIAGQVYKFEKGQREITSGTFGAMGLTIPLAIGTAIAQPNAQILAVTGDGSLELNIQELKTISYYNFNIKLFVINNGGYASMRNWQDKFFQGRRVGSDEKTGIAPLNLKNIAKAFGLNYLLISSWKEINKKLKLIMSDNKPLFIEVICDSNQKLIDPFPKLPNEN